MNKHAQKLGKITSNRKKKTSAENGRKAEEIRARLYINDISGMSKQELSQFKKWLKRLVLELTTEKDLNIFAKRYRATLYK